MVPSRYTDPRRIRLQRRHHVNHQIQRSLRDRFARPNPRQDERRPARKGPTHTQATTPSFSNVRVHPADGSSRTRKQSNVRRFDHSSQCGDHAVFVRQSSHAELAHFGVVFFFGRYIIDKIPIVLRRVSCRRCARSTCE